MKESKHLFVNKFVFYFYAVSLFMLNGYCYFRWSTYSNSLLSALSTAIYYIGPIMIVVYVFLNKKRTSVSRKTISIMSYTLFLVAYICLAGTKYKLIQMSDVVFVSTLFAICQMNKLERRELFVCIAKVYAIAVLPSLVYYIFTSVGFQLPYTILRPDHELKNMLGIYYEQYPFGLIMRQANYIGRYCGIFDEAGFVGTLAAFFVAAGYRRLDKKWWYLLLVEGLLSFSLAFYVLVIVFLIAYAWSKGLKKVVGIMIALILGLFIFMNIDFHNESIAHIQSRIDLTSFILVQDNRSNETTDFIIADFISDGGLDFVVGFGRGASNANSQMGGWTYKFLLYDFGAFGIICYIGFFVFFAWKEKMLNKKTIPFIAVFIASIYQRPYVLTIMNVSIFITAISFICSTQENNSLFTKICR